MSLLSQPNFGFMSYNNITIKYLIYEIYITVIINLYTLLYNKDLYADFR